MVKSKKSSRAKAHDENASPSAGWSCPMCTYMNTKRRQRCEMCEAKRSVFDAAHHLAPSSPDFSELRAANIAAKESLTVQASNGRSSEPHKSANECNNLSLKTMPLRDNIQGSKSNPPSELAAESANQTNLIAAAVQEEDSDIEEILPDANWLTSKSVRGVDELRNHSPKANHALLPDQAPSILITTDSKLSKNEKLLPSSDQDAFDTYLKIGQVRKDTVSATKPGQEADTAATAFPTRKRLSLSSSLGKARRRRFVVEDETSDDALSIEGASDGRLNCALQKMEESSSQIQDINAIASRDIEQRLPFSPLHTEASEEKYLQKGVRPAVNDDQNWRTYANLGLPANDKDASDQSSPTSPLRAYESSTHPTPGAKPQQREDATPPHTFSILQKLDQHSLNGICLRNDSSKAIDRDAKVPDCESDNLPPKEHQPLCPSENPGTDLGENGANITAKRDGSVSEQDDTPTVKEEAPSETQYLDAVSMPSFGILQALARSSAIPAPSTSSAVEYHTDPSTGSTSSAALNLMHVELATKMPVHEPLAAVDTSRSDDERVMDNLAMEEEDTRVSWTPTRDTSPQRPDSLIEHDYYGIPDEPPSSPTLDRTLDTWECAVCYEINERGATRCLQCSSLKRMEASSSQSESVTCPKCFKEYSYFVSTCSICRAKIPDPQAEYLKDAAGVENDLLRQSFLKGQEYNSPRSQNFVDVIHEDRTLSEDEEWSRPWSYAAEEPYDEEEVEYEGNFAEPSPLHQKTSDDERYMSDESLHNVVEEDSDVIAVEDYEGSQDFASAPRPATTYGDDDIEQYSEIEYSAGPPVRKWNEKYPHFRSVAQCERYGPRTIDYSSGFFSAAGSPAKRRNEYAIRRSKKQAESRKRKAAVDAGEKPYHSVRKTSRGGKRYGRGKGRSRGGRRR